MKLNHQIGSLSKLVLGALLVNLAIYGVAYSAENCAGYNDLLLVNAKIITVDKNRPTASSIRIQGNKIVDLDGLNADECTRTIDL